MPGNFTIVKGGENSLHTSEQILDHNVIFADFSILHCRSPSLFHFSEMPSGAQSSNFFFLLLAMVGLMLNLPP